jgi:hypothetical protein
LSGDDAAGNRIVDGKDSYCAIDCAGSGAKVFAWIVVGDGVGLALCTVGAIWCEHGEGLGWSCILRKAE